MGTDRVSFIEFRPDARYAHAGAPKPWVAKIVIARLDKASSGAG